MSSFAKPTVYNEKPLYGGALASELPATYADVSTFREVPDHQEVFVDNESEASLIVELFDYEHDFTDDLIIRHYFDDLAQANEATHYVVLQDKIIDGSSGFVSRVSADFTKIVLIGQQSVSKFRTRPDSVVDEVYIVMVLIRLKNVGTDLLISLNVPFNVAQMEEKFPGFDAALLHSSMLLESETCDLFQSIYKAIPAIEVLKRFVNKLEIRDWTLFGGDQNN